MTTPLIPTCSIDDSFSEWYVIVALGVEADPVLVAGRYELRRRIGRGGQGTVYEALDRELGRRVAVKILDLGEPDQATREGSALAKLEHPHVVQIYDNGVGPDFRYFVLQLLEGPSLREWCLERSPGEIVAKYMEAARGLEAAHRAGLVHRDFKPANVRIKATGEAVVVDFGLARNLRTLETDSDERGYVAGTTAYIAPERLLGQVGDERADQFSFCVALWEALAGVNPYGPCEFETSPAERFRAIQAGIRGAPRGPRRVRRALRRGLALRPGERFASLRELEAAAVGARSWGSAPVVAGVGLLALLGVGVGFGWFAVHTQPPPAAHEPASFELLTELTAESALVRARAGDIYGALQLLERAEKRSRTPEESRKLAELSQAVAIEFESVSRYPEAVIAWTLSLGFARDAGAEDLLPRLKYRTQLAAEAGFLTITPPHPESK